MKEYKVIYAYDCAYLEREIQRLANEGFKVDKFQMGGADGFLMVVILSREVKNDQE